MILLIAVVVIIVLLLRLLDVIKCCTRQKLLVQISDDVHVSDCA